MTDPIPTRDSGRDSRGDAPEPPGKPAAPLPLRESHTPAAIEERLAEGPGSSGLRDFIYGAVDGTVTTFAVVSGVAGAGLDVTVIVILGVANLIADGFSMGASNFLGTRAEKQQQARARREEKRHIELVPEGEREEIRQIFAAKGFEGEELEAVVRVITSDAERWVETMLREEHGIAAVEPQPGRAAWNTFFAFVVIGAIPLLPFLLLVAGVPIESPYLWSIVGTGIAFFAVGAVKGRFVEEPPLLSGLETLGLGGGAAALSYVVGRLLAGVAG